MIFVSASHQTGLDTRTMTWRSIILDVYGTEWSDTCRYSSPASLCWSLTHLMQCGPDEPIWSETSISVQARMPDYRLNWTRPSDIQRGQWCQSCTLPIGTWPSWSWGPFGLKSAIGIRYSSGTNVRRFAEKLYAKPRTFIKLELFLIFIYKLLLVLTIIKSDPKAPFSIATTPKYRGALLHHLDC